MAQPFELTNFQLTGNPVPLVERISYDFIYSKVIVSSSATGVLAYQAVNNREGTVINLFDRHGKPENLVGEASTYYDVRFSPDERRIAAALFDQQSRNLDIWLYEIARNARTRFTFDSGIDRSPIWSPDGTRIVFRSNRKRRYDIYQKALSGAGVEELLFESGEDKVPTDWSPDGRFIIYYTLNNSKTREDVWILPTFGDRRPIPVLCSEFSESFPRISPDGKWLAYQSDESGVSEIYAGRFLGPGGQPATGNLAGKWQISTAGGRSPVWGRNGKEIFYLNPNEKLMVAEIVATGATIEVRSIAPLFEARPFSGGNAFDVSGNGKRFVVDSIIDFESSSPIIVVVNWPADLKNK
jgi:Tol biopolymer transport system component